MAGEGQLIFGMFTPGELALYGVLLMLGTLTGRLLKWLGGNSGSGKFLPGLPVVGNAVALGRLGTDLIATARQQVRPGFKKVGVACIMASPCSFQLGKSAPEAWPPFIAHISACLNLMRVHAA